MLALACSSAFTLCVLVPATAVAAAPHDSVTGAGKVFGQIGAASDFSVAAHSGPQRQDPKGNLNFRNVDYPGDLDKGKGRVVCVLVVGTRAAVIAEFRGDTPFPGFPYAGLFVEDNGQPSGNVTDRGLAVGIIDPDCEYMLGIGDFAQPLLQGNVVVRDAN